MSLDSFIRDIDFEELPVALQVKDLVKRIGKLEQGETNMKYKREDGSPAVEPVKEKGGMFPGVFEDAEGKRVFPEGSGAGDVSGSSSVTAQLTSIAASQVRLEAAVRKLRTDLGL